MIKKFRVYGEDTPAAAKSPAHFVRDRVSNLAWGEAKKHKNTNQAIVARLNGTSFAWAKELRLKDIQAHLDGRRKLYFSGDDYKKAETLLYIDLDAQKSGGVGSSEGCERFARYLRQFLPSLYVEPSSSGVGRACYLRVKISHLRKAADYNKVYKKLEAWLKELAEAGQFDVEGVEVKGRMPEITWARTYVEQEDGTALCGRPKVETFKNGVLAKMPQDTSRFQEWLRMPLLTCRQLENLVEENPVEELFPQVILPIPLPDPTPEHRARTRSGSCLGKHIEVAPHHWRVAKDLMNRPQSRPRKVADLKINQEDIAVCVAILEFCSMNMNEDGSLPWERVAALWSAVYRAGDTKRGFNSKRFAALRDWISSLGYIEWKDHTYVPGEGRCCGENRRKGEACKWKFSERMLNLIQDATPSVTTHNTYPLAPFAEGDSEGGSEVKCQEPEVLPLSVHKRPTLRGTDLRDVDLQALGEEVTRLLRASWASLSA